MCIHTYVVYVSLSSYIYEVGAFYISFGVDARMDGYQRLEGAGIDRCIIVAPCCYLRTDSSPLQHSPIAASHAMHAQPEDARLAREAAAEHVAALAAERR